jgi:error-prone DNA polymerase
VFQIESRAQMGSLRRTRPATLADLTIQVALVRPGPIVGGAVNTYIARRMALLLDPSYEVPFLHPSLRECLAETLNTIVFQDQVIEVSQAFAGFSAGQAESLRRAMSRKRSVEAIEAHHLQFVVGAMKTHPDVQIELAELVWNMVAGFAGFGFPKSHGSAFGLLAYQSTWLRVHHPSEFLCALLSEQPMGFYPPDSLIHEAQHREVIILPPDVLHSEAECTVNQAGEIRVGLNYVKGVHGEDIEALIASRHAGGGFRNLADFAARAGVTTPTLERLAWSGACDELAGPGRHARRTALWQLGVARPALKTKGGQQLALELPLPETPALDPLSDWQAMIANYQATGISIDRHPLALLREQLSADGALSTADLANVRHESHVKVGGFLIARQKPQTANGIMFMLIEDEQGTLNVIVPQKLYERYRTIVRTEPIIRVDGILERHEKGGGQINLLAKNITRLTPSIDAPAATVRDLRPTEQPPTTTAEDFATVAPPAMNFAQGRRR